MYLNENSIQTIPLNSFERGIYFITIQNNNGIISEKIIMQE